MVMITRSAYKKACESSNSSNGSQNNHNPPWCSSGKVLRKQAKLPPPWEIQSSYPLRENIWEYLHDGKGQSVIRGKRRHCNCKQKASRKSRGKNATILFALVIIAAGLMASIWINNIPKINLLTKVIQRDKLVSLMGEQSEMTEECCMKMKYLAHQLSKVHQTLRHAQRIRRKMIISTQIAKTNNEEINSGFIEGATAMKGSDTIEYGGRVALWGLVPLWRTNPPPDIVLAQIRPTPSNCWPFSGSLGDIVIELPQASIVRHLSVEHIHPDTAKSAPKQFSVYGIHSNGTLISVIDGEYQNRGPAKQYYHIDRREPFTRLIFRVLSNQGNEKYTCIYRVHLYRG